MASGTEAYEDFVARYPGYLQTARIDELRARVKTAAREGRPEEALHWTAELQRVEEEVKRDR